MLSYVLKWEVGVEVELRGARQEGGDSKTNNVQPEKYKFSDKKLLEE